MNSRMMKPHTRLAYYIGTRAGGHACTKITFVSNPDGNYEVYVMNHDCSN